MTPTKKKPTKKTRDVTKSSDNKKRKKTNRRRRPMWRFRSSVERATDDALYLQTLVPVMRELGVTWFADVELGPVRSLPLAPMHRGGAVK